MEESVNSPAAPFNAAIDCLMRISNLTKKIEKVSTEYTLYSEIVGIKLNAGQAQHIKHRFVKQLIIQSTPLLSTNARKDLWDRVTAIQLKVKNNMDYKTGKNTSSYELYDESINEALDRIVLDLQIDLQDKGKFFMPPRKDPMRAVLQR